MGSGDGRRVRQGSTSLAPPLDSTLLRLSSLRQSYFEKTTTKALYFSILSSIILCIWNNCFHRKKFSRDQNQIKIKYLFLTATVTIYIRHSIRRQTNQKEGRSNTNNCIIRSEVRLLGIAGLRAVTGLFCRLFQYGNIPKGNSCDLFVQRYVWSWTFLNPSQSPLQLSSYREEQTIQSRVQSREDHLFRLPCGSLGYQAGKNIYLSCQVAVWGTRQGRNIYFTCLVAVWGTRQGRTFI